MQFLVTARPFVDKGSLTGFASISLTITAKTKGMIQLFVSMHRKAKVIKLGIFAGGKSVMVISIKTIQFIEDFFIVK